MEKSFYNTIVHFDFSRPAVLCSLLEWKGSVPRKDYPHMLVFENGDSVGTIGGGSLEHAVMEQARAVLSTGQIRFQRFELLNTDVQEDGSLCGGTTRILFEPLDKTLQSALKSLFGPRPGGQVVITAVQGGITISVTRQGWGPDELLESEPEAIWDLAQTVALSGTPKTIKIGTTFYHLQKSLPPPVLHIFGAGHVAKAVAELAHFIELEVHVYDDRPEFANPARFPHAEKINTLGWDDLPQHLELATDDFALIVTRGHKQDLNLLRWLVPRGLAYLGLMSSRKKWRILSAALRKDGLDPHQLKAVHAPVGLEIESKTVPEIAVSIIAEIIPIANRLRPAPRS